MAVACYLQCMATTANAACPDYSSHWANACDALFPGVERLTADQDEAAVAYAEAEYHNCEGH
jgi:hypothetical protein